MRTASEIVSRAGRLSFLPGLRDLFLPPRCLRCQEFISAGDSAAGPAHRLLCRTCLEGFFRLPAAHCMLCGRPFKTGLASAHRCSDCLRQPPVFDQALAAGLFEEQLRLAIHDFKYRGQIELARPLAAFMAAELEPPFYPPRADLIIPVPLHPRRLRQRGFNQSLLLARELFRPWREKIHFNLLKRTRWTEPQVNFSGAERRKNVHHAFSVLRPEEVKGRSVLLVDDVFTTGATVNECARVLKNAGAEPVYVLTLARVA